MTADLQCSFCGNGTAEARCLIRGPGDICICDACGWLCADILIEHGHTAPVGLAPTLRSRLEQTRAEAEGVRRQVDELMAKLEASIHKPEGGLTPEYGGEDETACLADTCSPEEAKRRVAEARVRRAEMMRPKGGAK
jgi:hypothetical protein